MWISCYPRVASVQLLLLSPTWHLILDWNLDLPIWSSGWNGFPVLEAAIVGVWLAYQWSLWIMMGEIVMLNAGYPDLQSGFADPELTHSRENHCLAGSSVERTMPFPTPMGAVPEIQAQHWIVEIAPTASIIEWNVPWASRKDWIMSKIDNTGVSSTNGFAWLAGLDPNFVMDETSSTYL